LFDENVKVEGAEGGLNDYLETYASEAQSENEYLDSFRKTLGKNVNFGKMFKVKRLGKDENDLFWQFGKIHGLENIAFVDEALLEKVKGNPVRLQKMVNDIDGPDKRYPTPENVEEDLI
jgi:hypothetical protein